VLIGKIEQRFGADLSGRTFAVWGLAFKPNTDDMREAPSRRLIAALRGATVRAYDPVAIDEARRVLALDFEAAPTRSRLHFVDTQDAAVAGADALVIVTEWKEFRSPDFTRLKAELKAPVIFDGRNCTSRMRWPRSASTTTRSDARMSTPKPFPWVSAR
jgi:UDPglucose 6-dehydrogenase